MFTLTTKQTTGLEKMFPGATAYLQTCDNINEYRHYRTNEYVLNGYEKMRMAELERLYTSTGWMTDDGQWTELYYRSGVE